MPPLKDFIESRRGQALGYLQLFASLIMAGVVLMLMDKPFDMVTARTRNATSNSTALTGTDWSVLAWDTLPIFFLAIGAFGIITLAVFRSRLR